MTKKAAGALTVGMTVALCLTGCGGSKSSSSHSSAGAASSKSSAASSGSASSSSSSSSGQTVDDAGLKKMATKLGCANPEAGSSTAKARSFGAASTYSCEAGSMFYGLTRLNPGTSPDSLAKHMLDSFGGKANELPYVKGPNWLVVVSKNGENDKPTKAEAQAVQQKIGGEVGTATAH